MSISTEITNDLLARRQEWDLAAKCSSAIPNSDDSSPKALKYDQDKPRYDLVPPEALDGLAKVLTFGAKKYADRNWELGMDWGRVYAALQRHILAWWSGQSRDPETGLSHLHHAACCIAFLQTYEARDIGEDTRPKTPTIKIHAPNLN